MASQEEFGALLKQANGGEQEWMKSWAANQQQQSPPRSRPPSNHNGGYRRNSNDGEQSPLLPQSVLAASQLPPTSAYDQLNSSSRPINPKQQRHGRSRSELPGQYGTGAHPLVDPTHPFNKGISPPAPVGGNSNRFNRPPRANSVVPQQSVVSPQSPVPYPGVNGNTRSKPMAHRRAKSDIPLAMFGSGGSSINGGRRIITKEDLLKNLPSPRWGGAPKPMHTRNRSRTGSDGPLMLSSDNASVSSGGGGPYGYGSISNVELGGESNKNPVRHQRLMSGASMQSIDASVKSVTTNMAKSALFKGVTDTGRIRLQLPKDSFRILMDCQLEAGSVYKRALVEDEDKFFIEFHEEEVHDDDLDPNNACHCTCDGCNRCHEKQKRLPPDLYVMAVDSTIYRRMLDEVIESRDMPCGTFFCGHHEDVRHPDITIAALIVAFVFFLLCALTWLFP